jgi:hypothetical protein
MYADYAKCAVCGSEVRLRANPGTTDHEPDGPSGPVDGVVGAGDDPVDVRECTNGDCPTRRADGPTP